MIIQGEGEEMVSSPRVAQSDPSRGPVTLDYAKLEEVARAATENLAAPGWQGDDNGYIWGNSLKGGMTPVAQVRGWGYLTGSGHGALGLSEGAAMAAQAAWEKHIATFDPPTVLRLIQRMRELEADREFVRLVAQLTHSGDDGHTASDDYDDAYYALDGLIAKARDRLSAPLRKVLATALSSEAEAPRAGAISDGSAPATDTLKTKLHTGEGE